MNFKSWISDMTEFMGYFTKELAILAIVFGIGGLLCSVTIRQERVRMHEAYHAWVKQTDNPKALTYEEWRALNRANVSRNTSIIFISK